jgi:hypothetical protein
MATVNFNFDEYRDLFEKLSRAGNGDFRKELATWLEALGIELLRIIEDEIIRRDVTDTRLLLHSFTKGDKENIWEITDDGLTLEVGTHVDYASYVNDGHWTNTKGVAVRFVPGTWNGDKFQYIPGAKTGMVLKQKWVPGKPYFDSALRIFEQMLPELCEAKLQQWLDNYFG